MLPIPVSFVSVENIRNKSGLGKQVGKSFLFGDKIFKIQLIRVFFYGISNLYSRNSLLTPIYLIGMKLQSEMTEKVASKVGFGWFISSHCVDKMG